MTPPHHLLVATDFSPGARRALDFAIAMAGPFDAPITLLHAYELPTFHAPSAIVTEVCERIVTDAQGAMSDSLGSVRGSFPRIEGLVRDGVPWEVVNQVARERKCDLIVVGTHGRHGLARALLGSVAERVVRMAQVPVVTVGPERPEGA